MKNSTIVTTHFQVSVNGTSWLSRDGYSKYYTRMALSIENKLNLEKIYGLPQAIEHVAEYYGRQDEYTEQRQKDVLAIQLVTTTTETIDFTQMEPIKNKRAKTFTVAETV